MQKRQAPLSGPSTPVDTQIDLHEIPVDGSTIRVTRTHSGGMQVPEAVEETVLCVTVIVGTERGRRMELTPAGMTVGRVEPADLVLNDTRVSRQHARLWRQGDTAFLRDLDSTNGSYVDGTPAVGEVALRVGASLRIGNHTLQLERRSRQEFAQAQSADADLARASHYVQALLPAPLSTGPIQVHWVLQPSARLGGDALGYHFLPDGRFACYLMDVSGHGVGAAMHAVSVLNAVRQQTLPDTDFGDPAGVLTRLNMFFPMESHDGMYLTMWYGVFDPRSRRLCYAAAGHHPAYLLTEETPLPLVSRHVVLGALPAVRYRAESVEVPAGAQLFLFSDGAFEIEPHQGGPFGLQDFVALIPRAGAQGAAAPAWLLSVVQGLARSPDLDDDATLMSVMFL